ncbi:MAG: N-methyl-L-tryptophan oxidase [Acidobacteria bacterium]|nr:N-methyl-L-tryptophan oxidase [Acidobacteriota bacterium]
MSKRHFDAAVLGLGSMGSFACLRLARRGLSVLGIDAFDPPHGRGSHSGDTRVFRIAYAEHPDYVPLAQRASVLWDEFSAEFGVPLLHRTGMLNIGRPDSDIVHGVERSARLHGLELEMLDADETRRRYPAYHLPEDHVAAFERAAGWVDVNAAITGALQAASTSGATLLRNTAVREWKRDGAGFVIETATERYHAGRLIISAGAYSPALLPGLDLGIQVERKVLCWFDPLDPLPFAEGRFPVFALAPMFLYGFPNIGGGGVKLAIHWDPKKQYADPNQEQPEPTEAGMLRALAEASRLFPSLAGPAPGDPSRFLRAKNCFYGMTSDEHFCIDRHPADANVIIAAGFSGHGFKFAPAVGEAAAEMAVDGAVGPPSSIFALGDRVRFV